MAHATQTRPTHLLRLAAVGGAFALLAACGSQASDDDAPAGNDAEAPATTQASSELPACADVWVADEDLPKGYSGCLDGTTEVAPEKIECSSGQIVITYDDHYWAVRGHRIGHAPDGLLEDDDYADMMFGCTA